LLLQTEIKRSIKYIVFKRVSDWWELIDNALEGSLGVVFLNLKVS